MKAVRALVAALAVAGSAATLVSANSNANVNDVDVLNFALQLEYLESTFYNTAMSQLNNAAFTAAGVSTSVRDYITLIQAHENAHVAAIQQIIAGYPSGSGTAGSACSAYSFTGTNFTVDNFLKTAIVLEDTGVSAYVGALNAFTSAANAQAAATIATVEGRHASFLRSNVGYLVGSATSDPFPNIVDPAYNTTQVISIAGSFFTNCSYDFANTMGNLPTVRPSGVTYNAGGSGSPPYVATSSTPSTSPAPSYTTDQFNTDISVLNYALTLEHLESDFYNNGPKFTVAQYEAAFPGQGQTVYNNIAIIAAHEAAHVQAITSLIQARGQVAVSAGTYNWTSLAGNATAYIALAHVLENVGVSAYDGAANQLTDTSLLQIAASVATVEARHAAYLNQLNGLNATTGLAGQDMAFDTTRTMEQVTTLIQQSLVANGFVSALTGSTGASSSSSGSSQTYSSSTGNTGAASSFAVPAFASVALAFVAALLF